jgi:flagellar assembly factor FliW
MTNEITPDAVVTFAGGLPGFELCRQFVLVSSPSIAPFTVLQGLDGPAPPAFIAIDPALVIADYAVPLEAPDYARLDAAPGAPLLWLAIVAANSAATVNLRAPLVINPASMRGIQVMPAESGYPLDHPLESALAAA